jgi:hypothetical protein
MFRLAPSALAPDTPVETAEEAAYRDAQILARCHVLSPWGLACAIDLGECDPRRIRDAEQLRRFALALCNLIGAPPCGEPLLLRRGAPPCGQSLVQLLESAMIAAHFAEESEGAYIDILSAKPYAPYLAADFCRRWFAAATVRVTITLRQAAGRGAAGDYQPL